MATITTSISTTLDDKALKRSRFGCFTCRKRKKRCDETKPICTACDRLKLDCVYPEPGMERKNRPRKQDKVRQARKLSYMNNRNNNNTSNNKDEIKISIKDNDNRKINGCSSATSSDSNGNDFIDWPTVDEIGYSHVLQGPDNEGSTNSESITESVDHHKFNNLNDHHNKNKNNNEIVEGEVIISIEQTGDCSKLDMSQKSMALQIYSPRDAFKELDTCLNLDYPDPDMDDLRFEGIESITPFLNLDEPDFLIFNQPKSKHYFKLDTDGQRLFDYFVSKQAGIICVSPENSFLNVFVPMASESDSVLYALVAWAGFHENGGQQQEIGFRYLNKAIQSVVTNFNKYELTTLAGLLLIAAAEICNGDVFNWNKHLSLAAQVIKMNGGLQSFNGSKTLQWLGTNFSYHDLLASSIYTTRNTYFAPNEYKLVMESASSPDALLGCCHSLFQLLAEISDLSVEVKRIYKLYGDDVPLVELKSILFNAHSLEDKIKMSVPDTLALIDLTVEQRGLQLNLFEVFRMTAKLHLAQSVFRYNAASLEMQCAYQESLQLIDTVLATPVEGGLILPLFVTGVACCSPSARLSIVERFDAFYERNLARNIKRTVHLLEEVWKLDDFGARHVDWQTLIESRGWDLCFA